MRYLLDVESQVCLMTNECLQRLQLKSEKIRQYISGINNDSLIVNRKVMATLTNKNKNLLRNISLLVVQKTYYGLKSYIMFYMLIYYALKTKQNIITLFLPLILHFEATKIAYF